MILGPAALPGHALCYAFVGWRCETAPPVHFTLAELLCVQMGRLASKTGICLAPQALESRMHRSAGPPCRAPYRGSP